MEKEHEIILETLTPIILDEEQKAKLNYSGYENILDKVMESEMFWSHELNIRMLILVVVSLAVSLVLIVNAQYIIL